MDFGIGTLGLGLGIVAAVTALAVAWARRRGARVSWRSVAPSVIIAVLLVIAASRPRIETPPVGRGLAIVLDVSASVTERAGAFDALAREALAEIERLNPADSYSVIAIGVTNRIIQPWTTVGANAAAPSPMAEVLGAASESIPRGNSALARALDPGVLLTGAPDGVPIGVLLVTDGGATDADVPMLESMRRALNARGIDVVARAPKAPLETVGWSSVDSPARVRVGAPIALSARLRVTSASREPVPVAVQLERVRADGSTEPLAIPLTVRAAGSAIPVAHDAVETLVALRPGLGYRVSARVPTAADDTPGLRRFRFVVRRVDGADAVAADDVAHAGALLVGPPRVLLVVPADANGDPSATTFGALLPALIPGVDVVAVTPSAAPSNAAGLVPYTAVVLDGVSRADFGDRFAAFDVAVTRLVRDAGLGVLMVGSQRAFGPGGWINSAVDEALPVHADPNRERPAAVVLMLDRTGSMQGGKFREALGGAIRFLDTLGPRDAVALATFQTHKEVAGPQLTQVWPTPGSTDPFTRMGDSGRTALQQLCGTLAGRPDDVQGTTNLHAALEQGTDLLADRPEPTKLLVLLSDGSPSPDAPDSPADPMSEAYTNLVDAIVARGIFVACAAVSTGDALDFFGPLAERINGAAVLAGHSPQALVDSVALGGLTEAFVQSLRHAHGPLLRVAGAPGEPAEGFRPAGLEVPALSRYARTQVDERRTPAVLLRWRETEPAAAIGRFGLGPTGALVMPFDHETIGAWASLPEPIADSVRRVVRHVVSADAEAAAPYSVAIEEASDGSRQFILRWQPTGEDDAERPPDAWFAHGLEARFTGMGIPLVVLRAERSTRFVAPVPELPVGAHLAHVVVPDADAGSARTTPIVVSSPVSREWTVLDAAGRAPDALRALNGSERADRDPLERASIVAARSAAVPFDLAAWFVLAAVLGLLLEAALAWRAHRAPRPLSGSQS